MDKNILIISATKSIIVKGIASKLEGLGFGTISSSTDMNELTFKFNQVSLVVLYLEETDDKTPLMLEFVGKQCEENDLRLIVIASKEEKFEEVLKVISRIYILKFFIRPFPMETFLDTVEDHFASSSIYAKHKNILIVDDDPGYMNLINDWLKDRYRVSMVSSGVSAITWLATNHADLILLDYEMPLTDGPKVLEMIRSQPETADIPVIFLTGKGDKESIMSVLALKPTGYLLKTIDKKGLLENVIKILGA